jgi:hypothetical protein
MRRSIAVFWDDVGRITALHMHVRGLMRWFMGSEVAGQWNKHELVGIECLAA